MLQRSVTDTRRLRSGRSRRSSGVELATMEWVSWFNTTRLHSELGYRTPTPGRCPLCGLGLEWRYHESSASIYSWIGVDRAIFEWEAGLVPFSVVLARIDGPPDVKLPCLYAGPATELRAHQHGTVRFGVEYGEGVRLMFDPEVAGSCVAVAEPLTPSRATDTLPEGHRRMTISRLTT